MKNNKKEKRIIFILIVISVILFMGTLLPYNYPSDIYNIFILGYKKYASTWFMTSGRVICAAIYYLFDFFNISLNNGIFILKILSIFISSYTIYLFYNLVLESINSNNKKIKYLILIPTILIFLNYSTYEWFYYTESAIMWLGILSVVIALKTYFKNTNYKYLKIFLLLFLSVNCYQSAILFYIPALFFLLSLQKKDLKYIIKELFYNSLLVLLNLVIGYIIVIIARNYINFKPYKSVKLHLNFKTLLLRLLYLVIFFSGNFPNIVTFIINVIIILYLLFESKEKKLKLIAHPLLIWLIGTIEVLLMIEITNFYLADRIMISYVSTMGMFLIYALLISNKKILFTSISILLLLIQIINSNLITIDSKKTRNKDKVYGEIINKIINNYEKENNIKIKKIEFCYDSEPTGNYQGIIKTSEPTNRGFSGDWTIDNIFNYYCPNHNFSKEYNQKIYKTKFKSKNWDDFSEEQIIFENDTLYFCIY